jgi:hypothetical protein
MTAKRLSTTLVALTVLVLAVPATAQVVFPPEPLVVEGEIIPGVGTVTSISNVAINNSGAWIVEVDTDNPNTDTDSVLIKSGALFLREGDPLAFPVGADLGSFDSVNINDNGDSGWNFFLDNLPSSENSGVYFNSNLVIQESDTSGAPEFTPGTPYIGFFDVKMNNGNLMLLVASIDDPAISSSVDRALVRVLVGGGGALISESVLAKEGEILPGQTEPVADFGTGPHQSDINDAGQILYFADLSGSTSTDGTIYRDLTLLAQEGSPSPVAGRNYEFLSSRGLDLNNNGDWVFKANLDGSTSDDDVIIVNGSVFRQEGDTLPAIAGFNFTSFGSSSGPVKIDDDGDVLWFGDWNDPDTTVDTGLFLNDRLIVQEGVTQIGGLVIDTISSGSDAFDFSDDGSYVIFEATFVGGINAALRIEISDGGGGPNEPPVALCRNVTVTVDETCQADASIDAGSFDPDGDPITLSQAPPGPYDIGDTLVTLTVTDDGGLSDTCTGTVTVVDPVPPEISVVLDPAELWPPNHRMIDVDAIVTATDNCSTPAVELISVTSSEPDNGEGDGDTIDDIQGADIGTADFLLQLRAERAGTGNGRTYTATYTATDSSGNQTSGAGTAFVPHDQGGKTDPVETTMSKTGKGSKLDWTDVPGASYYNVIRGDLGSLWVDVEAIHLGTVRCVTGQTTRSDTEGREDPDIPAVGEAFFYVVEYVEAGARSGYGTESAPKPRVVDSGDCE